MKCELDLYDNWGNTSGRALKGSLSVSMERAL